MDAKSGIVRVVVADANIIINLIHVSSLGLLPQLAGYEFVVPGEVIREVIQPDQALVLRSSLGSGHLREVTIEDLATLHLFAELTAVMGAGEAACLGLAQTRGWLLASDEKGIFRREAVARLGSGRIVNTAGLLVLAIRAGVMTVEEADRIKHRLEQHRFRMGFTSFREVI